MVTLANRIINNYQYDTSNTSSGHARSCIAIFESPDSAARAIAASPIDFPLPTSATSKRTAIHTPSFSAVGSAAATHVTTPHQRPLDLRLRIQQSHHNHLTALKRNPYYTAFYPDRDSYQYKDLVRSTGIPIPELAAGGSQKREYVSAVAKRMIQSENEQFGATSLWRLYEQGMAEEEGEVNGNGDTGDKGTSSKQKTKNV